MKISIAVVMLCASQLTAQYGGRSGVRYRGNQGYPVRQTSDFQPDRRDGKCTIRVRVDDEADITIRGNRVEIFVIKGAPGRDEGSECNTNLPTSGRISNFRFSGVDGRGSQRLVQEPSERNRYYAVVNIQDPNGGDEGYTFDITWEWDGSGSSSSGSSSGGFFPGSGSGSATSDCESELRNRLRQERSVTLSNTFGTNTRQRRDQIEYTGSANVRDRSRRQYAVTFRCTYNTAYSRVDQLTYEDNGSSSSSGGFFPAAGSIQDMDQSIAGNGSLYADQNYQLTDLRVQVRNSECRIRMITNNNQQVEFWGPIDRNARSCDLRSANSGSVNAQAQLNLNGSQLQGMTMNGNYNGRSFRANFQSR